MNFFYERVRHSVIRQDQKSDIGETLEEFVLDRLVGRQIFIIDNRYFKWELIGNFYKFWLAIGFCSLDVKLISSNKKGQNLADKTNLNLPFGFFCFCFAFSYL